MSFCQEKIRRDSISPSGKIQVVIQDPVHIIIPQTKKAIAFMPEIAEGGSKKRNPANKN